MRILLLTLNTNKNDAGPACSSTPWLNHGSLGCYQTVFFIRKPLFLTGWSKKGEDSAPIARREPTPWCGKGATPYTLVLTLWRTASEKLLQLNVDFGETDSTYFGE
jgi:hypothetical protein